MTEHPCEAEVAPPSVSPGDQPCDQLCFDAIPFTFRIHLLPIKSRCSLLIPMCQLKQYMYVIITRQSMLFFVLYLVLPCKRYLLRESTVKSSILLSSLFRINPQHWDIRAAALSTDINDHTVGQLVNKATIRQTISPAPISYDLLGQCNVYLYVIDAISNKALHTYRRKRCCMTFTCSASVTSFAGCAL